MPLLPGIWRIDKPTKSVYNYGVVSNGGYSVHFTERSGLMRKHSVQQLTTAGVMAALVFVMTYIPKVPVPMTGGYVHLGDGAIFLSALLLGPLGIPVAAIGSGLSDILGGYMLYVLPTMIIKALVALIAWKGWKAGSWVRAVVTFILAEAAMVAGYFVFEAVVYGAAAAWAAVGPNCIQGIAGVALGLVCHVLYPRMKQIVK